MATSTPKRAHRDFCLSLQDLASVLEMNSEDLLKDFNKVCGNQRGTSALEPKLVRKFMSQRGYVYPHQVFSFQMLKGGVAKTTSALNVGLRAAMYGARILFIDLDQQANLTFALGIDGENSPAWIDLAEKKKSIREIRQTLWDGVDLIPSNLNNSVLDRHLMSSSRNWSQAVVQPLKDIRSEYDLVIIDTAPNLSFINTAVTLASDQVILPINPDKFSMLGLRKHLEDLAEITTEFSLTCQPRILFTKFDGRESSSREILGQCLDSFDELLMKHYIRTSSEIKNIIGTGKSLFSAQSKAKEDYDLVTRELLGLPIQD